MPVDTTREHLWGQLLLERNLVAREDLARLAGERDLQLRSGMDCSLGQLLVQQRRLDTQSFLVLRQEVEGRGRACWSCRRAFLAPRPDDPAACPTCGGPTQLPPPGGAPPVPLLGASGRFQPGQLAGQLGVQQSGAFSGSYPPFGPQPGYAPPQPLASGSFPPQAFASGRFPPGALPAVPAASGRFGYMTPPPSSGRMPAVLEPNLPSLRWNAPRSTPSEDLGPGGSGSGSEVGVGKRFGRFEIIEELGRGGMGVVYKVREPGHPEPLALKVLLAGEFASPKLMERFREEARLARRLQHPNIVAVHDVGEVDGIPYYAMDYVPGCELQELIRQKNLSIRRGVEILVEVAKAAHYAHQNGVIHRDLKPSNVLVAEDGTPFIMDFGLAKNLEDDKGLTRSGVAIGTPYYMPPEQARGSHREMDARSDVYALGAILYEVLTRRVPFTAKTQNELLRKIVEEEPEAPRLVRAGVPAPLELVALKALSKEKNDRYESAESFAEDLERYLRNEPVLARAPSLPARLLRKARKNPTPVIATGAVLLVSLVAGAVVWGLVSHIQQEQSDTVQRELDQLEQQKQDLAGKQLEQAEREKLGREAERAISQALDAYASARAAESPTNARESLKRADELLKRAMEVETQLYGQAQDQTAYRRGLVRRGLCRWREANQDFLFAARGDRYRARGNLARGLLLLRWACDRAAATTAFQEAQARGNGPEADEERAAEDVARAYGQYLRGDPQGALSRLKELFDRERLGSLAPEAHAAIAYLSRVEGEPLGGDELSERGLNPADRAVEAERFRYEFLIDRAILRARAGRREEALRDVRAARALDADGEEAELAEAVVHARLGDPNSMQAALDVAHRKAKARVTDAPGAQSVVELFEGRLRETLRKNPPPPIEAPPIAPPQRQPPSSAGDPQNRVTGDMFAQLDLTNRREIKMQVEVDDGVQAVRLIVRDYSSDAMILAKWGTPARALPEADVRVAGKSTDLILTLRRDAGPTRLKSGTWHVMVVSGSPQHAVFQARYYRQGEPLPPLWVTLANLENVKPILPRDEARARRIADVIERQGPGAEQAVKEWAQLEQDEDEPLLAIMRGQWCMGLKLLDQAEEALRKVLARYPGEPRAVGLLTQLMIGRGKPELAVPLLRDLVKAVPDYLDGHYMLADCLLKSTAAEDLAEAVAVMQAVVDRDPELGLPRSLLGEAQLRAGKVKEGLDQLRRSVQGNEVLAAVRAAEALLENGQAEALLACLEQMAANAREGLLSLPLELARCRAMAAVGRREDAQARLRMLSGKVDGETRILIQRMIEEIQRGEQPSGLRSQKPPEKPDEAPKPPAKR